MYHYFNKFGNTLSGIDNCTLIYNTISNTLPFTLPIFKMHMCIIRYNHDITCFGTKSL
ncbi:hypothetical protein HanPSC8_Chr13g0568991 [Helianthus annuus]|nr:hypothetical protein HanPSC8_Chr13g0568991 [Helianthus annuus]